jgi:tRNA nucleotidyltransferase (CCA-adding enzyme)
MPIRSNYDREEVKRLLTAALPSDRLAVLERVSRAALERSLPLYLVGGFVRDLLLGRPGLDFDLVVEGDAVRLAKSLGGKVTVHSRFGTAQWWLEGELSGPIDLITARRETYARPGALPTVRPGSLEDDLRRRDFSINTLAVRLDGGHFGELRDDLGGLDDLRRGRVRALHPGSYRDDPTRILRAARYEQRYRFEIAAQDLAWIAAAKSLLERLSGERLRHELDLILEEPDPPKALRRLSGLGVLAEIHPSLGWTDEAAARLKRGKQRLGEGQPAPLPLPGGEAFLGWHFWLMDRPAAEIESLEKRLHFHADLFRSLLAASAILQQAESLANSKPSACTRALEEFPPTAVYAVCLAEPPGGLREKLTAYLETWRYVKPKTTGHTLKKYGLEPGPVYRDILQEMRAAWLDGEIDTPQQEQARLQELFGKQHNGSPSGGLPWGEC